MPSVTRKRQGSRADRRQEIRGKLLAVVERLLEDGESFTEISVERMVSEAGVSRSTFYVYFEDKGDLLTAWFEEIRAEVTEAADSWWALTAEATRDDVRAALDRIVKTYRPHTTLMAAVYDAAAYDANVRELVTEMMDSNVAGLRKHIKAGQKAGFVDDSLLPAQTAGWLTWMAERGLHQLVRTATPAELDKLIDAYTDIVWNTLYAPAR
ncbi:Transcriptional regulator TetR family [Patulibacter medicamentivorans]|jgi:AcrR family transcriptional regulator|uniref:Transcriptional regulator TetR family n=1 Tax=Patulibacter medicamentivorans TaxID=1097667 RepID=H0E6R0_9ACTN|nr:TetR/AcrR family transcriptional regulator [Patulibacter medicamentivorans]EHN10623.1 Transcriptional regulator TetR family [Patulibacter medicamentivorans]